jgi:hypothetical protein
MHLVRYICSRSFHGNSWSNGFKLFIRKKPVLNLDSEIYLITEVSMAFQEFPANYQAGTQSRSRFPPSTIILIHYSLTSDCM